MVDVVKKLLKELLRTTLKCLVSMAIDVLLSGGPYSAQSGQAFA